jgi:hypothetical protein
VGREVGAEVGSGLTVVPMVGDHASDGDVLLHQYLFAFCNINLIKFSHKRHLSNQQFTDARNTITRNQVN